MPQDQIAEAIISSPAPHNNWLGILVVILLWGIREMMPLIKQRPSDTKKDISPLIENQTALLEEQQQILTKLSSILDLCTEKVLTMSTDIAILKDRSHKERD